MFMPEPSRRRDRRSTSGPIELRFTQETVSVPAIGTEGDGEGIKSSADLLHFLWTQLARALPNQHSSLVIHCFAPFFLFGSLNSPSIANESCRAAG
jgi:hypothetical protein